MQASVEKTAARTIATFTRDFDADFTGEGDMDMLCAFHATDAGLAFHTGREGFTLSLEGGAAAPGPAPDAATPRSAPADADDAAAPADTPLEPGTDASTAPAPLTAAAAAVAAVAVAVALL